MKMWKKWLAVIAASLAAALVLAACGGGLPNYSNENEEKITEHVDELAEQVLDELFRSSDWADELKTEASGMIINAMKLAGITNDELTEILDLIDDAQALAEDVGKMTDSQFEKALQNLVTQAINLSVSDDKIAAFLYEVVVSAQDIVEAALDEEVGDSDFTAQVMGLYDDVLGLGKTEFVNAFSAAFSLARLQSSFDAVLVVETGDFSEDELSDMILAYKADALKVLDILDTDSVRATGSFVKIFTPFIAEDMSTVSYYESQIEYYESEIEYWERELAALNPGDYDYDYYYDQYTDQIAWYEGQILDYEEYIDEAPTVQEMTAGLNELIDLGVSEWGKATATLKAMLNKLDAQMADIFASTVWESEATDRLVIAAGKIAYAGLNATGGINKTSLENDIVKVMTITGGLTESQARAEIAGMYDEMAAAITYLNGLNYNAAINWDNDAVEVFGEIVFEMFGVYYYDSSNPPISYAA